MNKIIKRSLILTLIIGMFSCTDLEEDPVGLLAPEAFFKEASDVETAVLGIYSKIATEPYFGRKLVLTLLLRGDMVDIGDLSTFGRRIQVNEFDMDAFNGMVTGFWPRAYETIGSANAAIFGSKTVTEPANKINQLKAEALFLRAFTYYHLVRLFGDVPYIDSFIDDPDAIKDITKTPASEIYKNIITDLQFAKQNLPDNYPNDIRSRPTKGTAAAYLASVYLTLGDHQEAYNEAKWVIDNKSQFGYGLMADYAQLYDALDADGLDEHIFMVDFLGNISPGSNLDWMGAITGIREVTLPTNGSGWSVAVPTFAVFESWDERDYRKEVSFVDSAYKDGELVGYDQFATTHGASRPHIAKYWANPGNHRGNGGQSDNNYAAMRYAEVLLIAAEALNEINGGPNAEAEGYINQIKERARNWAETMTDFPEDVTAGLSQADFHDLVIEERRLELAFEFKRWYDIKRLDIGNEAFKGVNSLEPHDNFDPNRDYLLPLPQDELDRNPNLLPQNNGY